MIINISSAYARIWGLEHGQSTKQSSTGIAIAGRISSRETKGYENKTANTLQLLARADLNIASKFCHGSIDILSSALEGV